MIVVECNADELLINSMGFSKKKIDHAGCKGKVLNTVRKLPKAVGIIDEDPHSEQPGELKKYEIVQKKSTVTLLRNKGDKSKFLIKISPDLENWILKRAKQNNINTKDFSVPGNPKELHSLTRIKQNKKFIDFLNTLIACDSEIKVMVEWIQTALK